MITRRGTAQKWSRPLRLIHLLLAAAVTIQLFLGSCMHSPHPDQLDSFGFAAHAVLGAMICLLVTVHWIWSCTHPHEGWRHLLPWTRVQLGNVVRDVRTAVRQRRLPAAGPGVDGSLAGFVHGLGLLAVTAVVLAGATFYLSRLFGLAWGRLDIIEDIHDTLAVIVWIYWGGHLAMTIVHGLLHQPVYKRMLRG